MIDSQEIIQAKYYNYCDCSLPTNVLFIHFSWIWQQLLRRDWCLHLPGLHFFVVV